MGMYTIRDLARIVKRAQPNSATCWLACFEMMEQWLTNRDPSYVSDKLEKKGCDVPTWKQQGMPGAKNVDAAAAMGLHPWPAGAVTAAGLDNALKSWGPLWAAGRWGSSTGHVVVVTGFDVDREVLTFIDPWPEPGQNTAQDRTGFLSWFNAALFKGHQGSIMNWPPVRESPPVTEKEKVR